MHPVLAFLRTIIRSSGKVLAASPRPEAFDGAAMSGEHVCRCLTVAVLYFWYIGGLCVLLIAFVGAVKQSNPSAALLFVTLTLLYIMASSCMCSDFHSELGRPLWRPGRTRGTRNDGNLLRTVRAFLGEPPARGAAGAPTAVDVVAAYEHQDEGPEGGAECIVCLGEVEKGEMVKRLPLCLHLFHEECIDKWLRTHSTCPICRYSVFTRVPPEVVFDVQL